MISQSRKSIWHSINLLDRWVERNGWKGFDPYDIKGHQFYFWLHSVRPNVIIKILKRIVYIFEEYFPIFVRRLFFVDEKINAKGMGLFASAYLNLYQNGYDEKYKNQALACLDWLENHPSANYEHLCWGYPFDWQSAVFIPEDTPSSVVTSIVGDSFWRAYQAFDEQKYLEICKDICNFFINYLNIDVIEEDITCFSYTPLDNFHVHNANLFVAEFLIRVGKETKNRNFVNFGIRAANYALSEQNSDGSLNYWGRIQNEFNPNHIDHYHSGFEIRALYGIWKSTKDDRFLRAVSTYYQFYRQNLFFEIDEKIIPKMTPDNIYPIDVHACAESLLCNSRLAKDITEAFNMLPRLYNWIIGNMQTPEGWFIYRIDQTRFGIRRRKIPYIRWGQAWMMLALSEYLTLGSEE